MKWDQVGQAGHGISTALSIGMDRVTVLQIIMTTISRGTGPNEA